MLFGIWDFCFLEVCIVLVGKEKGVVLCCFRGRQDCLITLSQITNPTRNRNHGKRGFDLCELIVNQHIAS